MKIMCLVHLCMLILTFNLHKPKVFIVQSKLILQEFCLVVTFLFSDFCYQFMNISIG